MAEHPGLADATRDERERDETPIEQLDRNWTELLQELRVLQTGVQLLTGFLLTLPFQSRFESLPDTQNAGYLATVASAVLATGFLIAPVSVHRTLFRRHKRRAVVDAAANLAQWGLRLLAVTIVGVVEVVFNVVAGGIVAWSAAAAATLTVLALWVVLPHHLNAISSSGDDRRTVWLRDSKPGSERH